MDHVSTLLTKVLNKRGLLQHARASLLVEQAQRWIGQNLSTCAEAIHVKSYKDGVVLIECEHSIASQECQHALEGLKTFLTEECNHHALQEIRLQRTVETVNEDQK